MHARRIALKLAWEKTVTDLFGSWGRITLSGFVGILLALAMYGLLVMLSRETPEDALLVLIVSPLVMVGVGVIGFLINWVCRIPYREWALSAANAANLEKRLSPKFSAELVPNSLPERFDYGTTTRSWGGTKQTIVTSPFEIFRIDITNLTSTTIEGCEAYLSKFAERNPEVEKRGWQSLRLAWLPVGEGEQEIDIPPEGQRSIVLFQIRNNRVLFSTHVMPVQFVHQIQDQGEYEGLVAVTARNCAATFIPFRLATDAPDSPPQLELVLEEGYWEERPKGLAPPTENGV